MTGNDHDQRDYLTIQQLADLLQVSAKSITRWAVHDRSMPVLRIGRTVRFPKERVLKWLRSREQGLGRAKQSHKLTHSPITNGNTRGIVHDGAACA